MKLETACANVFVKFFKPNEEILFHKSKLTINSFLYNDKFERIILFNNGGRMLLKHCQGIIKKL